LGPTHRTVGYSSYYMKGTEDFRFLTDEPQVWLKPLWSLLLLDPMSEQTIMYTCTVYNVHTYMYIIIHTHNDTPIRFKLSNV